MSLRNTALASHRRPAATDRAEDIHPSAPRFIRSGRLGMALLLMGAAAMLCGLPRAQAQEGVDPAVAQAYNEGLEAANRADWPTAKAKFTEAVTKDPTFKEAHYNLGLVLQNSGDLSGAEKAFRKALELDPDHPAAQRLLADALAQQGKFADAVSAYDRAIALDSTRVSLYFQYAEAMNRASGSDQYSEVMAAFDQALSKDPKNPGAYSAAISMGSMAMKAKKYGDAVKAYERAGKMRPDDPIAFYNAGIAYKNQKKFESAVKSFETALTLRDPYGQAHFALAGIYYSDLKDEAKALRHYEAAAADGSFDKKAKAAEYAASIREYLEKKAAAEAARGGN